MDRRILLVDTHNLVMRYIATNNTAFYAIFKFLLQFIKTQSYQISEAIFVFDSKRPEFRKRLLPTYKSTRTPNPKIVHQINQIKNILPTLGLPIAILNNYEADDCIYKIIKELPDEKFVIYSADKDFIQLDDDRIHVFKPIKKGFQRVKKPNYFMIRKVLLGDKSDNIDGILHVGPVTADKIVEEVQEDTFPLFLEHLDRSSFNHLIDPDILSRNYKLMNLNYAYENYTKNINGRLIWRSQFYPNKFISYCHKFRSQSLISRAYYLESIINSMGLPELPTFK